MAWVGRDLERSSTPTPSAVGRDVKDALPKILIKVESNVCGLHC